MPLHIPSPRGKRKARIEIIPLIDIVFFLLATFVMVSLSMVQNRGIPVNLPTAATGAAQSREDQATISISENDGIFFERKPVTPGELDAALKRLLAENPEPRVFINGDEKASFGAAIAVLDQVRRLGITKIAIETKAKNAP